MENSFLGSMTKPSDHHRYCFQTGILDENEPKKRKGVISITPIHQTFHSNILLHYADLQKLLFYEKSLALFIPSQE
jgi:hypothetical protein